MKHILIDFENAQPEPEQLAELDEKQCHIWLFLGRLQQRTLSVELCEALCRFGKNVHFIRVARVGKNALDFYLAYYLGKITEQDKDALICILSRDGGFDVLVEHLAEYRYCRGIVRLSCLRDAIKSETDLLQATQQKTVSENLPIPIVSEPQQVEPQYNMGWISKCFKKTLNSLMPDDAFRPVMQHNLALRLKNVILAEELKPYDDAQRQATVSVIFNRLVQKDFVSVDTDTQRLRYHLSKIDLLDRIIKHLLTSRPRTIEAAKRVLQSKAESLNLAVEDEDMEKIIQYCQAKKQLRVVNKMLSYPSDIK